MAQFEETNETTQENTSMVSTKEELNNWIASVDARLNEMAEDIAEVKNTNDRQTKDIADNDEDGDAQGNENNPDSEKDLIESMFDE